MYQDKVVLCGANSYEEKYYLNPDFDRLPDHVKDELKIMCVLYVNDVGGILTLVFEEDGELCFEVTSEDFDPTFDDIGSHLKIIVKPYQYSPTDSVDQIVNLATEARMKGLLSLEDKLNEIDEPFLHNSLMLVVDSVDSEKVRKAMETELEQLDERHALDRRFYEKAASFAPAFGMIGTLVGLILMLGNMSDVDALAKGMAVALITTLYGSLLANVVCLPMASKLKARHDEEFLCKQLVMEGVLAIQEGENPKFIEEKLYKLLPASYKKPADKGEKQDGNNDGKKNSKKKGIGKRRRWNKKEIEE